MFSSWFAMFATLLAARTQSWLSTKFLAKAKGFDAKIHDYSRHQAGVDYFLDLAPDTRSGYMTSSGAKVRVGDLLRLSENGESCCYLIEAVDYYCDTPGLWIASLKRV